MTSGVPGWAKDPPPRTGGARGDGNTGNQWVGIPDDQAQSMRKQLLESIFSTLVEALTGLFVPGGINAGSQQLNGWSTGVRGDINGTWDALIQAWTGTEGIGFDIGDLFGSAYEQRMEMTGISTGLARLIADQKGQYNSGKTFSVIAGEGVGIPAVFTKIVDEGTDSIVDEGDSFAFPGNTNSRELFLYNDDVLITDFFEVSLIVSIWGLTYFGSAGNNAVYLVGRSNTSGTTLTFARVSKNRIRIGAIKAGSAYTSIANPYWFGPEVAYDSGAYITFRGGITAGVRFFQVLMNNQVAAVFEDTAGFSLVGDSYRTWGWGIGSNFQDLVKRAPHVSHLIANDNAPAPLVGTQGRVYRASTSDSAAASGGVGGNDRFFPANGFDTVDYMSGNLSFNTSTGEWTLGSGAPPGPYRLEWAYIMASSYLNQTYSHTIYVNDVLIARGGQDRWESNLQTKFGHGFTVNLKPGDTVRPGQNFSVSGSMEVEGEAGGVETWCTLTYMGSAIKVSG